jgi:hypothetical protein
MERSDHCVRLDLWGVPREAFEHGIDQEDPEQQQGVRPNPDSESQCRACRDRTLRFTGEKRQ